jgi:PAB-dependent poly(A)-specific ribonuclease subunit 2
LVKDFRIANIFVPPAQVRDTVELFKLPGQRNISLRFLAAFLLGQNIQSDNHDSVDDARAALLLYQKYDELKESGELNRTLNELYAEGRRGKWKSCRGIALT